MNTEFPSVGRTFARKKLRRDLMAAATMVGLSIGSCPTRAQFSYSQTFNNVNLVVPDGSGVGVSDTRQLNSGLTGTLTDVRISIEIAGAYTGDLYVALLHDGVSSVLLNRVGRRVGDDWGYTDSGLNVTFSDSAPSGDVHTYRLTLSGNHDMPLGGPLGGAWQPDARTVDPGSALDTNARSAYLSVFKGFDPDGWWTLYLADLAPVGESTLHSWTIGVVVPESGQTALLCGLGLLGFAVMRRRRPGPQ